MVGVKFCFCQEITEFSLKLFDLKAAIFLGFTKTYFFFFFLSQKLVVYAKNGLVFPHSSDRHQSVEYCLF